jgi:hypothetical protein
MQIQVQPFVFPVVAQTEPERNGQLGHLKPNVAKNPGSLRHTWLQKAVV